MSTEPRSIKVTRSATKTISGDQKAIESAKTGTVTAVVAVMYFNGKTKVNLHSANPKKRDTNRPRKAIGTQRETDSPRKTIRVLLDTGSNGDLLLLKKGSTTCIPVVCVLTWSPARWGRLPY